MGVNLQLITHSIQTCISPQSANRVRLFKIYIKKSEDSMEELFSKI